MKLWPYQLCRRAIAGRGHDDIAVDRGLQCRFSERSKETLLG